MKYSHTKKVNLPFKETVTKVKEELSKEGFGILCEIDVKTTLKKKVDVEYENYIILGACSPSLAYQALQAEKEAGLLLPCNVIIYEEKKSVFVSTILPTVIMETVGNTLLGDVAAQVELKLKKVIEMVSHRVG